MLRLALFTLLVGACSVDFDLARLPRSAASLDATVRADASDVPDARDASDVADASDVVDASDVADASDVVDASDVADASDVSDVVDVNDASDVIDAGAVADVSDAGDVIDAGDVGGCAPGLVACGAGCVDTQRDGEHCGRCGTRCGSGERCTGGFCVPVGCPAGFANCDGATGCQTNILQSTVHCGECGRSCAAPSATVACVNGSCAILRCAEDHADCDGRAANGCEVSLDSDAANCGACGRACDSGDPIDHLRAVCVAGRCLTRCLPGWFDCNGNPDCEFQVSGPTCGPCAMTCAGDPPPGRERVCCSFVPSMPDCCSR